MKNLFLTLFIFTFIAGCSSTPDSKRQNLEREPELPGTEEPGSPGTEEPELPVIPEITEPAEIPVSIANGTREKDYQTQVDGTVKVKIAVFEDLIFENSFIKQGDRYVATDPNVNAFIITHNEVKDRPIYPADIRCFIVVEQQPWGELEQIIVTDRKKISLPDMKGYNFEVRGDVIIRKYGGKWDTLQFYMKNELYYNEANPRSRETFTATNRSIADRVRGFTVSVRPKDWNDPYTVTNIDGIYLGFVESDLYEVMPNLPNGLTNHWMGPVLMCVGSEKW